MESAPRLGMRVLSANQKVTCMGDPNNMMIAEAQDLGLVVDLGAAYQRESPCQKLMDKTVFSATKLIGTFESQLESPSRTWNVLVWLEGKMRTDLYNRAIEMNSL